MANRTSGRKIYIKTFSLRKNLLEYCLAAISCAAFFMLFLSQIGLFIPQARSNLTDIDVFEGTDYAGEFPEASLVLEADSPASAQAVVLLNGTPYAQFSSERCTVSILNRGLIEIDGRLCDSDFSVTVKETDSELRGVSDGDTFLVGRGMTIIGRVEVLSNSE